MVIKSIQFIAVFMKAFLSGQDIRRANSSIVKKIMQMVSITKNVSFRRLGISDSMSFLISGMVSTINRATATVIAMTSKIAQTLAPFEEVGTSKNCQLLSWNVRGSKLSAATILLFLPSSMMSIYLSRDICYLIWYNHKVTVRQLLSLCCH